jgi:nitrilase
MTTEAKHQRFKASVVQASLILFDTTKTLLKLDALTRQAATDGAKLIVFPEALFVGGAVWYEIRAPAGLRTL